MTDEARSDLRVAGLPHVYYPRQGVVDVCECGLAVDAPIHEHVQAGKPPPKYVIVHPASEVDTANPPPDIVGNPENPQPGDYFPYFRWSPELSADPMRVRMVDDDCVTIELQGKDGLPFDPPRFEAMTRVDFARRAAKPLPPLGPLFVWVFQDHDGTWKAVTSNVGDRDPVVLTKPGTPGWRFEVPMTERAGRWFESMPTPRG